MLQKFFIYCTGRHTAFAAWFTVCGTALAWFHRLGPEYVALVTAIQGLILAHSYKEDRVGKRTDAIQDIDKKA